jgi:hypothetical protein
LHTLAGITTQDPASGYACETCGQPLGLATRDPEPLYYHLHPSLGSGDHEARPSLGDLPPAGAVIVVSPRSALEITPNVDGNGLTGLTVRDGDQRATVALHTLLVDEACHQLALHTPIPLHPEPGFLDADSGVLAYHGASPDGLPDHPWITVAPLPDLDAAGRTVIDAPDVQAAVAPDAPGCSRLIVRHAGAVHAISLPEHVLARLLDQARRQLIQAACEAALAARSAQRPNGGDR